MPLSREEVMHIATLCRIELSPEDVERLGAQLSLILSRPAVLANGPRVEEEMFRVAMVLEDS